MTERTPEGRFAQGNPGGPGRPRRTVERDYIATLSEAVTLDAWRSVIEAAIAQARNGDDKARAWLSKYCLGEKHISLLDLAAQDVASISTDEAIARQARRIKVNNKRDDAGLDLQEVLNA